MKNKKIGLLIGPDTTSEALAIRSCAEYLGYEVATRWIGRPQDFVDFWQGKLFSRDTRLLLLCFHGKAGKFVMPRLAKEVYFKAEPRKDLGHQEIANNRLKRKTIISTACTVGQPKLARQITQNKSCFIAPKGEVEGNAALIFVQLFLYQLLLFGKVKEAFERSAGLDEETAMFRLFKPQ